MNRNTDPSSFAFRVFGASIFLLFLLSVSRSPVNGVYLVNSLHTPALDVLFSRITFLGNGIWILPVAILLLFQSVHRATGLVLSGLAEGAVVLLLKRVFFARVTRPITRVDLTLVHRIPGIEIHSALSFPSGHTVTIFGLCVFLALCCKNNVITVFLALLALLVGLSRVYLLQHFITDVAAGALIGTVVSVIVYHAMAGMDKPRWMNLRLEVRLRLPRHKPKLS